MDNCFASQFLTPFGTRHIMLYHSFIHNILYKRHSATLRSTQGFTLHPLSQYHPLRI
jgi:hypothetical protein